MSNNSWKQYGGISKMDDFNVINASTIIAEQFVSRSTKPIYQYLNGTFEVSMDLSAGINIMSGNSIYSDVDIFVNNNIHANNKIYFGGNTFVNNGNTFPAVADDDNHAFLYGNANFIGLNTTTPNSIFNITGVIDTDTNIVTIESKDNYIRNILGQNVNKKGVVLDADDTSANIHFFIDNSTNILNNSNAHIKCVTNGGLYSNSYYNQIDTSGGSLYMGSDKFNMDSSGDIFINTNNGLYFDSSFANVQLNGQSGDVLFDTSGQYVVHASGGYFLLNQDNTTISTNGFININASGGLINLDSSGGNIIMNSMQTTLNTLLDISPYNRGVSGERYNETVTIYDNSNSAFLHNVYDISNIYTGTSIVGIGKDSSANTFLRLIPANSLQGSAYGGGVYPYDTSKSMNMIGINDICGNFIPNIMSIEGSSKTKLLSTTGFNTYMPKNNLYAVDINGPTKITNGEIHNILNIDFEVKSMSFSSSHPLCGIITGYPSTIIYDNDLITSGNQPLYEQYVYYTTNGGTSWNKSNIYNNNNGPQVLEVVFNAHMYDCSYGFIFGNFSTMFYTNDGGINWYQMQYNDSIYREHTNLQVYYNNNNFHFISPYKNITNSDEYTKQFISFDISINDLNNNIYTITNFNDNTLNTNITCSFLIGNYIFMAGNGIVKFNISTNNTEYYNNNCIYNAIYAYDEQNVVAVGNNCISYTFNNGDDWTDIDIASQTIIGQNIIFNDVAMLSSTNIIAIGDNGTIAYTEFGPNANYWKIIPNDILNTSGTASIINGTYNKLNQIHIIDSSSFIICNNYTLYVNNSSDSTNNHTGLTKLLHVYSPYIFNIENTSVLDVCGNMNITGNIDIYNTLKVNNIDSINSDSINIGNKTQITNIGHNDNIDIINSTLISDISNYDSVLNIGSCDNKNSIINIGNYNKYSNHTNSNIINIGAHKDIVSIDGIISHNNFERIKSKSDGIIINNRNINWGIKEYINYFNFSTDGSHNLPPGVTINTSYNNMITDSDSNYKYFYDNTVSNINLLLDASINNLSENIQPYISNMISQFISNHNYTDSKLPTGVSIINNEYTYDNSNAEINNFFNNTYLPYSSSAGSGIFFTDNLIEGTGYIKVSNDMSGFIFKPTNLNSNAVQLDINTLTLSPENNISVNNDFGIHDINNGIIVLQRNTDSNSEHDYNMTVKQVDISNILIRDSVSSTDNDQYINSNVICMSDLSINGNIYAENSLTADIINAQELNVFTTNFYGYVEFKDMLHTTTASVFDGDISLNKRLFVGDYSVFNDVINANNHVYLNKQLTVKENSTFDGDVLLNTRLFVNDDISFNGRLYVNENTTLNGDVSLNNRLFVSDDVSLNKQLFVNENTTLNGDVSLNNRLFVFDDVSLNKQLFVNENTTLNGDVSLNNHLFVSDDVSFNKQLYVADKAFFAGDISLNDNLYVGKNLVIEGNLYVEQYQEETIINTTTTDYNLIIAEDISLNGRMFIRDDVSLNNRLYVNENCILNGDVSLNNRLFVTDDVSLNKQLFVNEHTTLNGDVSLNNNMDVLGNISSSSAAINGKLVIYENTGSIGNATTGSLTIEHGDQNGYSSIIFPSYNDRNASDDNKDYGYIRFQDDMYNNSNNRGLLTIGTENDTVNTRKDNIAIMPGRSVGIGTNDPNINYIADFNGSIQISGNLHGAVNITASNTITGGTITGGTITGGTITDGTASLSSGALTGATNITASNTITGGTFTDGTANLSSGTLSGVTNITAGTINGGTITDGTASLSAGVLTGTTNITASNTITAGTFTDGVATLTSGSFSGITNLSASGELDIDSLFVNNTIKSNHISFNEDISFNVDASGTYQGFDVSISNDGTIIAIGALQNDPKVLIYKKTNGIWSQLGDGIQDTTPWEQMGYSVSLSPDGTRLAVGANKYHSTSTDSNYNKGQVIIYYFSNNSWNAIGDPIIGDISGSSSISGTQLGTSVALSNNGARVVIGALFANQNTGLVKIYQYNESSNSKWDHMVTFNGNSVNDYFGKTVSISEDGNIVAITSYGYDTTNLTNIGIMQVYKYINNTWTQIGDNITGIFEFDNIGWSGALSGDGTTVAVGSIYSNTNGSNSGIVRVYKYVSYEWVQIGSDFVGDNSNDNLGYDIALSTDGTILSIGTMMASNNFGRIRNYKYNSNSWILMGEQINGTNNQLYMGGAIALSGDGRTIISGLQNINDTGIATVYNYTTMCDISSNNMHFYGDISLNNYLSVANDVSLNNRLYVNENTTLNGDVSLNNRLFVLNDVSLNSNLSVNNTITGNTITDGTATLTSGDLSGVDNIYINGNLYKQGLLINTSSGPATWSLIHNQNDSIDYNISDSSSYYTTLTVDANAQNGPAYFGAYLNCSYSGDLSTENSSQWNISGSNNTTTAIFTVNTTGLYIFNGLFDMNSNNNVWGYTANLYITDSSNNIKHSFSIVQTSDDWGKNGKTPFNVCAYIIDGHKCFIKYKYTNYIQEKYCYSSTTDEDYVQRTHMFITRLT